MKPLNFGNTIKSLSLALFILFGIQVVSQTYVTRNGFVRFFSEAPLENIEATNRQVSCALDIQTGEIAFRVIIRSFRFEKALMQEHFNDNFMESQKFPNATYEGKILNIERINFNVDGVYDVTTQGSLKIKDVTKQVTLTGKLTIKDGKIMISSKFQAKPADYNIKVPTRFVRNIAETLDVFVNVTLEKRQ
jgi:polyisoprenoid-binding protein YceI